MIAKVRTHGKIIDLSVDIDNIALKYSDDPDVIRMWLSDECLSKNGYDFDGDDEVLNMDVIVNAVHERYLKFHPAV